MLYKTLQEEKMVQQRKERPNPKQSRFKPQTKKKEQHV